MTWKNNETRRHVAWLTWRRCVEVTIGRPMTNTVNIPFISLSTQLYRRSGQMPFDIEVLFNCCKQLKCNSLIDTKIDRQTGGSEFYGIAAQMNENVWMLSIRACLANCSLAVKWKCQFLGVTKQRIRVADPSFYFISIHSSAQWKTN